jgi:hypothetical protein
MQNGLSLVRRTSAALPTPDSNDDFSQGLAWDAPQKNVSARGLFTVKRVPGANARKAQKFYCG